ncbi:Wzz/FepE/Etk N-terminal domain-containing protein [Persephonella sp.]
MEKQSLLQSKNNKEEIIYYQEDEIDLYELWLTLKRRWKVIAAVILVFVGLGILYIVLSTPLYRTQLFIKNQEVGGTSNINIAEVIGILKAKYNDNKEKKNIYLDRYGAFVDKVSQASLRNKEKINLIKIEILGLSKENNKKIGNDILKFLQQNYSLRLEHYRKSIEKKILEKKTQIKDIKSIKIPQLKAQKRFLEEENIPLLKAKLSFYKDKLKKIDELIRSYHKSIKSYEQTIQNLSKSMKNPNLSDSAVLMLLTQIAQYENLINALTNRIKDKEIEKNKIEKETIPSIEKEIKNVQLIKIKEIEDKIEQLHKNIDILKKDIEILELKLLPPLTEDFKIIEEISSEKPVKPKKTLIIAVATISGLFLGIFLAFFLEWMENARKRHQDIENHLM